MAQGFPAPNCATGVSSFRGVSDAATGTFTEPPRRKPGPPPGPPIILICKACKREFAADKRTRLYCGKACSGSVLSGEKNPNWRGGASADQAAYALARYYRDPQKWRARAAAREAIKRGKLIPPAHCPKCGEERKLQAHHHNGYEREHWLDVEFSCDPCHRKEHRGRKSPKAAHAALAATAACLFLVIELALWRLA